MAEERFSGKAYEQNVRAAIASENRKPTKEEEEQIARMKSPLWNPAMWSKAQVESFLDALYDNYAGLFQIYYDKDKGVGKTMVVDIWQEHRNIFNIVRAMVADTWVETAMELKTPEKPGFIPLYMRSEKIGEYQEPKFSKQEMELAKNSRRIRKV